MNTLAVAKCIALGGTVGNRRGEMLSGLNKLFEKGREGLAEYILKIKLLYVNKKQLCSRVEVSHTVPNVIIFSSSR